MAIEVTDVGIEKQSASASSPSEELSEEGTMEQQQPQPPAAAVAAPRARGRPAGSKDKQPRKRAPPRASFPDDIEDVPPAPRPPTRRSTVPRAPQHSAPKRRFVQFVAESDSADEEEEEEEEEETPPPSPRTRRHQEWTAYRQQKATAHQANVNHYASLFDRMLA